MTLSFFILKSKDLGEKNWMGIISSKDFSRIVALEYDGWPYTSTDQGATWISIEGEANPWGCFACSDDCMIMMMTDLATGNAHGSFNAGETWTNIYTNMHGDDQQITACSVTGDGTQACALVYFSTKFKSLIIS